MRTLWLHSTWQRSLRLFVLGGIAVSLLVPLSLALPGRAGAVSSASDNFARANGSLGASWTAMTAGGLAISNDAVIGTQASGNSGDIYTGQAFGSDQFSQIQVTSTQISGGQWIGPAVRAQNGGQSLYVGIYYWNYGTPQLELFKLVNGAWTQLGSSYSSGALPAGTSLSLAVTGSTLSFSENGVVEVTATDTSLTGGAPAIMAYGTPTAGAWAGGNATTGGAYSIGGTISGLSGTVVLGDNGGDPLSVGANGTFTFATPVAQGAAFAVTVTTQPSGQTCSVANGSGTVGSANVTNVSVTCGSAGGGGGGAYSIGGTISGLSGTVVLGDNGGDPLSVGANGTFTFATPVAQGAAFAVTVTTQPSGQTCSVANGSGTVGSANVTNVSVTCGSAGGGAVSSASDNFARANGSLGASWTAMTAGGLAISNDAVIGTQASGNSGDIYTGQAFGSDQFSQIQVTSTQISGGQWIGPAVRAQNGGQSLYVGIYYWNYGTPQLELFKLVNGAWTQLGSSYSSGALPAGTSLSLAVTGSTLSFSENGVVEVTATDTSLTGGAPAIMAYGTPTAGDLGRRKRDHRRRLFHRRHHFGALGDSGARRQRRGSLERRCQRHLHLRHPRGPGRRLRRDRDDPAFGSDLLRRQRVGHRGIGERHQRLGHLWLCGRRRRRRLFHRRHHFGALGDSGARETTAGIP